MKVSTGVVESDEKSNAVWRYVRLLSKKTEPIDARFSAFERVVKVVIVVLTISSVKSMSEINRKILFEILTKEVFYDCVLITFAQLWTFGYLDAFSHFPVTIS